MKRPVILPDVNLLLAYGWRSHQQHEDCRKWFFRLPRFATCAITELGFLRVSMSPAYRASHEDALMVLDSLKQRSACSFLDCNLPADQMSPVASYKDITDSYLVALARHNACRFATLDEGILAAPWATGVAYHPFRKQAK